MTLDDRKFAITKGMKLTCDAGGPVLIAKSVPGSDLEAIRKRIEALQTKLAEATALIRRARA